MKPLTYKLEGTELEFHAITASNLKTLQALAGNILGGLDEEDKDPDLDDILTFLYVLDTRHKRKQVLELAKDQEAFEETLEEYGQFFPVHVLAKASEMIEQICTDSIEDMIEPDELAAGQEKKTTSEESHLGTSSFTTMPPSAKAIQTKPLEITITSLYPDYGQSSTPILSTKESPANS